MPSVVPSVVAKFMDWKLSAELVGVWVIFISMASLVEPSAGAKVPVISRTSPMVVPVAERVRALPVVMELATKEKAVPVATELVKV